MIYKGIFWLIEGELYTKKLECDKSGNVIGDGSGLNSKSGDNFNHRLTWEGLPKNVTHGKEYNYYPRGRVEIKGGKAVIYLNHRYRHREISRCPQYDLNGNVRRATFHRQAYFLFWKETFRYHNAV